MPKRSGISRRFSLRGSQQIASSPRLFRVRLLVFDSASDVFGEQELHFRQKKKAALRKWWAAIQKSYTKHNLFRAKSDER